MTEIRVTRPYFNAMPHSHDDDVAAARQAPVFRLIRAASEGHISSGSSPPSTGKGHEMRKDVREFIRRLESVGLTVEPTPGHYPLHLRTKEDHGLLYAKLAPAKERFKALGQDQQEEFRKRLKRFVHLYSFLSQVVPYLEARSERVYVYARHLANYLPREERGGLDLGEDEVVLTHLRQVKTGEHNVKLTATDERLVAFTGDGHRDRHEDEKGRLSEVIEVLNERFGLELGDSDKLYFEQIETTLAGNAELKEQAQALTRSSREP
jgi:hypothetical protein